MTHCSPPSNPFILEAFDCDLCCPVAQTRFHVADIVRLRSILGADSDEDPELNRGYYLDDADLAALAEGFGVGVDQALFESTNLDVRLRRWKWHRLDEAPYLIHTGYELPLLLDGRKKLAKMYHGYPPMTFDGEDRFDHWVTEGVLHREDVLEPFDPSVRSWCLGGRTVYYTPKGEEWRIPAMKLIWEASSKAGGWNEYFERLEGMLFGYQDWQNDWWIDTWLQQGGFGRGLRFCCAVTSAGLAWVEAAGLRALPPVEGSVLMVTAYDADKAGLHTLLENPDHAAVIGFRLLGRYVRKMTECNQHGPWRIQAEQIGELNKHLWGLVGIVGRRHDLVSSKRSQVAANGHERMR